MKQIGMHRCPGCREVDVSNAMLACLPCWRKLSDQVRREVLATRRHVITHPLRLAALTAAMDEWRGMDTSPSNL